MPAKHLCRRAILGRTVRDASEAGIALNGLNEGRTMDFDDQLRRYFGTANLASLQPEALAAGIERMRVELGLEKDRSRRFALWALLHMLGAAPDLDVAFKDAEDREAARTFMDLVGQPGPVIEN